MRKFKKECEVCGKQFLVSPYRKSTAQFCSRKCWDVRGSKREIKSCPVCKKDFKKRGKFCSKGCFDISAQRRLWGTCYFCKERFWYRESARKTDKIFCSRDCLITSRRHGLRVASISLVCPVCKKPFKITHGEYNKKKHKEIRCSPECYLKRWLSSRKPNDGEKKLGRILRPFGFKYVGNGKLFIGKKNPDFVNGKNLVELFGGAWHTEDEVKPRIAYMKTHGYRCLVIWYSELQNPQKVLSRVRKFITR